jgi:hypothetical protein
VAAATETAASATKGAGATEGYCSL